ncbi:UNKNOWN [Stylonychia lemnae]|uniref:Uncharacterized protein n=1 Tax=Stylonychia lemnae TaxID=5949 RepID=A0A078AT71_STYLE|nr:UNKNOWN [Stylonychia lemnae]|eukprot:CDW84372.1 UNKNOWN [Stylonychia lemnae]
MNPIQAFKAKQKLDQIKSGIQEGSTGLFMFFVIFNFLIVLSSLGVIGCSIYLFVITKQANAFNVSFLITGIVLSTFSILAFKLRKSIHLLGCYLLILALVFFFMLIVTIIMLIKKSVIVEAARRWFEDSGKTLKEIEDFEKDMNSSVVSVSTALIFFCGIIVRFIDYNTLVMYNNIWLLLQKFYQGQNI